MTPTFSLPEVLAGLTSDASRVHRLRRSRLRASQPVKQAIEGARIKLPEEPLAAAKPARHEERDKSVYMRPDCQAHLERVNAHHGAAA